MYRVECYDQSAGRWYVIGGRVCRTSALEWIAGRRAKGLRAKYRVVKDQTPAEGIVEERLTGASVAQHLRGREEPCEPD